MDLIENSDKKYAIRQLINKVPKIKEVVFKNEQFAMEFVFSPK